MTQDRSLTRPRRTLSASLWSSALGLAVVLQSGLACAADPREAVWKMGRVRSTSDIPSLRPIHLCLRRTTGNWSAELNPRDGSNCEHAVYADMFGKAFYVVGNDRFPLDALREARVFDLLDEFKRSEADSRERERIERYRSAFRDATTLEAIAAFETLYRGNDPDGFIPQLAPLKQRLQLETYRQKFASMQTADEIQAFIADYAANDLEGRLPQARRMLVEAQNKAVAAAKRAAEARTAADKQRALPGAQSIQSRSASFTVVSSRHHRELTDAAIASRLMCKSTRQNMAIFIDLAQNFDLIDSSAMDGSMSSTTFRGMRAGRSVAVKFFVNAGTNLLSSVWVDADLVLACDADGRVQDFRTR